MKNEILKTLEKITKSKISLSDKIIDLPIDSLAFIELIADVEEKYKCEISDEELLSIKTVEDIVKIFKTKLKSK